MDETVRSLADVLREAGYLNDKYEEINKTQQKVKKTKREIVETKLSAEDIEAYTKKAEALSVDIDALIDRVSRLQDTLAKIKFPDDKAAFGADKIKGLSSELERQVGWLNELKSGISKINADTNPRIIKNTKSQLGYRDSDTQKIRNSILSLSSEGASINGNALSSSDLATTPGYDKALKSSASKLRSYDREATELIKKLYTLLKIGDSLTLGTDDTTIVKRFEEVKQKVDDTSKELLEYKKLVNSTSPKVGDLGVKSPKEKFGSAVNSYIKEYINMQTFDAHIGDELLTLDKLPDIIDPRRLNDLDKQALKIRNSIVGSAALMSMVSFADDEGYRGVPYALLNRQNLGYGLAERMPRTDENGGIKHTTQADLDILKGYQDRIDNKALKKIFTGLTNHENLKIDGIPLEDIDTKKLYEDREKFGKLFSTVPGRFWFNNMLPGIGKDYLTPEASKRLVAAEQAAAEKAAEEERAAAEQAAAEQAAAEQAAVEKAAAEKAEADRLSELQKLKDAKIAAEKAAAEKAAAEQIAENKKGEEATTSVAKETTQALEAETAKRVDDTKKVEEATVAEVKKAEEATTSAAKDTTQALETETSNRITDTKSLAAALEAEIKKTNTDIVADTKNTADQNAATYRAMQKQQAADATVLARSLNRIQNEESKTRIENLKQQNSLARIDAKSTADKSLETQRQNGKLEVENAKAVAKEKELAAKEAAREKAAADKAASEVVKQQNKIELENVKQQHRLELEHEKAALRDARDEKIKAEREKVNAAKQSAREELEETRRVEREKRELARESERAKRDIKRALAQEQKEQEKREKQAAKEKEKAEKDAARAAAQAEKDAAKAAAQAEKDAAKAATQAAKDKEKAEKQAAKDKEKAEKDAAKNAKQAAKDKEKAEKDAAKAAAQAEKDAAKKAEEAAKTKKEAWQIVGNAIKKVADIVKNSLSKALSLVKKDIQLTVSLVKKGVDLFKSAGNTILRVLNLFGNFGDRLRSLFSGGIINGVIKGFNGLLNTVADVPNKILDNRFVQVGESLLASIQSLNILIGKDLTGSTIAWANELERGFGLSADGLIADMRGVAGVLKGLGMDGGDTATASKNLTIMSRSFSVMLGYKPEEAMSKIESGMKGMTQSVDDLGISVREAEMNSFLKDLKSRGGEFAGVATSFQNLNEEQRVYVRYAAMIDQYLKAFSIEKYAKSLDTITGRLSILRERTRAFMSAVGNLFLQLFNKLVVPLTYAIDVITQKIKALTSFLGLSSELSANMNGMTDEVGTAIDTSGSVKELGKEAKALDDVSKAAKEAKGGIDSFDHITSMHSSSSSGSSKSGDGADGSDFDYSTLMDLNADDLAKRMEEMSKTMEDHTNSYKNKVKEGLTKIREAIDTWYTGQTGSKIDWNKIFNLSDFKKATEGMGKSIARAGKAIKDTFGVLVLKFAQDINLNRVLSKSLGLINEALGALADILAFLKPILIELYDEVISPIVKELGDKVATALDGARAKLVQFREDLASGKYSNIKIVIRTLLTGETSEDDLNYLKGNDIMKDTNLSGLNTVAEKIHTVFEDIYTLVKGTASVIFDTIKETFNGEHKTLFDVIKDTIKKLSNFVSENHDAIVEILTALLELQATVIEAVVNAILSIAKWLVEHKDTVVKVLNRIEDIVDWLGKHIGVVLGFYLAIKTLSILSSAVTWISTFVTAIGTLKAALNIGGAASAAGTGGGGLLGRLFGRGTSTGTPTTTPTTTSTMPDIGGARSTDLGGNTTAGAAGATGATGLKAFAAKAAVPAAGVTTAIIGSNWELYREHNKLVEQSQDWRGLSEEVRKTEMALAKANGQGFIGTGADATSLERGGFFGLFKTVGSYFDKGDTPLNTEFVAQKAKEKAEEIKNILDGEKTTYNRIEEYLEDANIAKQFKDLGYGEEVTNAAIDHFRAVLYSELEDSIDKDTNKLSDDAIKVNSHINDYVKKVSDSSVESQYKLKATVDSSINTINNSTNTMKTSLSSVHSGINNANSTMQNMLSTSINSVDLLRLNVNTLSTDIQGLNTDTSYALSAIRSVISSASSALSGLMSGVMSTIGGVVGIPSIRNIFGFANGGAPKSGQMFIAREDGMPELVGNFGGYSGVANNDMIVRAMHDAIYDGMRAAGAGSTTYGGNGGTVNFNNYGYFGGDRASFRQFAEMINNANKSSDSNIANRSFRS